MARNYEHAVVCKMCTPFFFSNIRFLNSFLLHRKTGVPKKTILGGYKINSQCRTVNVISINTNNNIIFKFY